MPFDGTLSVVLAHPPATSSDLDVRHLIQTVIAYNTNARYASGAKSDSGSATGHHVSSAMCIKFDFKDPDAVAPTCDYIDELWPAEGRSQHMLWFNADIITGPGGKRSRFDPTGFANSVASRFPRATLSLGWTVDGSKVCSYTAEMIDQMICVLATLHHQRGCKAAHVTFPVSAGHAHGSQEQMARILSLAQMHTDRATLTFWGDASPAVRQWIGSLDPSSCFVDCCFIDHVLL